MAMMRCAAVGATTAPPVRPPRAPRGSLMQLCSMCCWPGNLDYDVPPHSKNRNDDCYRACRGGPDPATACHESCSGAGGRRAFSALSLHSHGRWGGSGNTGKTRKSHRSHEELGGLVVDRGVGNAPGGVLGEVLHRRDWHSARDLRHTTPLHTPPRTCSHTNTPDRTRRRDLAADLTMSSIPDVSPRSTFYIGDATAVQKESGLEESRPPSPTPTVSVEPVCYEDQDVDSGHSGGTVSGALGAEWRPVAETRGRLVSEGDALAACARPASAAFSESDLEPRRPIQETAV